MKIPDQNISSSTQRQPYSVGTAKPVSKGFGVATSPA